MSDETETPESAAANESHVRDPFCDEAAELKVLTAILDPVVVGLMDRIPWLEARHFFFDRNRKFFEAARALHDESIPITPTSIKHWLEDRKQWVVEQDWQHVVLITDAPFEMHIDENARRVVNKYTMEQVVCACEKTMIEAGAFAGEATEFAERFERRAAIITQAEEKKQHSIQVFTLREMVTSIATQIVQGVPLDRCTTGIAGLDDDIGGLPAASVTIAAADTNWGKTNLCVMVADENLKAGKRVLIVSAEDREDIYGRRILSRRASVNAARLRDRKCTDDEIGRIAAVVDEAPNEPFFLRAIGAPAEIIASRLQRLCERHAIQLVLIDYIQAMRMGRRMPDRRIEVNEATRLLTDVVKNTQASGLFFSQIRRLGRGELKPDKHDLKESGDLENASEGVLLGYRKGGSYRLVIDKSKDGTKNEYELDWDGDACCFTGGRLVEMTAPPETFKQMANGYAQQAEERFP